MKAKLLECQMAVKSVTYQDNPHPNSIKLIFGERISTVKLRTLLLP